MAMKHTHIGDAAFTNRYETLYPQIRRNRAVVLCRQEGAAEPVLVDCFRTFSNVGLVSFVHEILSIRTR